MQCDNDDKLFFHNKYYLQKYPLLLPQAANCYCWWIKKDYVMSRVNGKIIRRGLSPTFKETNFAYQQQIRDA